MNVKFTKLCYIRTHLLIMIYMNLVLLKCEGEVHSAAQCETLLTTCGLGNIRKVVFCSSCSRAGNL